MTISGVLSHAFLSRLHSFGLPTSGSFCVIILRFGCTQLRNSDFPTAHPCKKYG